MPDTLKNVMKKAIEKMNKHGKTVNKDEAFNVVYWDDGKTISFHCKKTDVGWQVRGRLRSWWGNSSSQNYVGLTWKADESLDDRTPEWIARHFLNASRLSF